MTSIAYWDNQFDERAIPHSEQNAQISKDFISKMNPQFLATIQASNSIIEIGCGTGELSHLISLTFSKKVLGTDLSESAINYANNQYSNDLASFSTLNVISVGIPADYDLAICSNMLEHFKNPFPIIDKVITYCKSFIILVPYDQPNTDGYEYEGGAGHVFRFTEESFKDYQVISSFIFQTNGWQHSALGETPLQLAVLLQGK